MIPNLSGCTIGIVVDRVSDVTTLTRAQIKPPPEVGARIDIAYVTGLGAVGEQMLVLVDIESMLAASDHTLIEQLAA